MTETMTQESLFEGLIDVDVPSRTVLTSVLQDGLLKKSIFANNSFIYHFDDIRDAIDLVLRSARSLSSSCNNSNESGDKHNGLNVKNVQSGWISTGKPQQSAATTFNPASSADIPPLVYNLNFHYSTTNSLKMNELFNSEEVRFACSFASENLLNCQQDFRKASMQLPSASILITLSFLKRPEVSFESVPFERVDVLVETVKGLLIEFGGPILACSDLKRCLKTGSTFKFFAEFYRISDCKKFIETSDRLGGQVVSDENVQISFEGVQLYDIDREALFFCTSEGTEPDEDSNEFSGDVKNVCDKRRKDSISSIDGIQKRNIYVCSVLITHSCFLESVITEASSYCSITSMPSGIITPSFSITSSSSSSSSFEIDLWKIENGLDKRTTCMIKNIPNKYNQQMIFDLVNESHRGCFDFLYLRMDFRNRCNVGYAFINFTDPQHILSFARRVNGKRWARFNSDKVCHLTFARIQGTAALIEKFRNSKVMFEAPAYRPKLFHTDGPLSGQEIPFPT